MIDKSYTWYYQQIPRVNIVNLKEKIAVVSEKINVKSTWHHLEIILTIWQKKKKNYLTSK